MTLYIYEMAWQAEPFHYENDSIWRSIFVHPDSGEQILVCDGGYETADQLPDSPPNGGGWVQVRDEFWIAAIADTDDKGRPCWYVLRKAGDEEEEEYRSEV